MQDDMIVALYWQRNENAIKETEVKYGRYLFEISYNILKNREDGRESVNDTYLKAWNAMPPDKPNVLSVYLGKITRRLSIDTLRKRERQKRGGNEYYLSLSEMDECVSGGESTVNEAELRELARAVSDYLYTLPSDERSAFTLRYYYMKPLKNIARLQNKSTSAVKSMLYRIRQGLKQYLEKEDFDL